MSWKVIELSDGQYPDRIVAMFLFKTDAERFINSLLYPGNFYIEVII